MAGRSSMHPRRRYKNGGQCREKTNIASEMPSGQSLLQNKSESDLNPLALNERMGNNMELACGLLGRWVSAVSFISLLKYQFFHYNKCNIPTKGGLQCTF